MRIDRLCLRHAGDHEDRDSDCSADHGGSTPFESQTCANHLRFHRLFPLDRVSPTKLPFRQFRRRVGALLIVNETSHLS